MQRIINKVLAIALENTIMLGAVVSHNHLHQIHKQFPLLLGRFQEKLNLVLNPVFTIRQTDLPVVAGSSKCPFTVVMNMGDKIFLD